MADFAQMRRMMVDNQIRTFDVTDQGVLAAMDTVERENFVPANERALSYTDRSVTLTFDGVAVERDLLSPMVVARMLQAAELEPDQSVLDVASGTGYTAAVMARLVAHVTALESDVVLAAEAERNLASCGNVTVVKGPVAEGASGHGPYDVIMINGAIDAEPLALLKQLKDGGRLIAVNAAADRAARIVKYTRTGDDFGLVTVTNAFARKLPEFTRAPSFVF
jgi:protein-L-isoaspartate(D-aspartate) O-methyltransferase